MSTARLNLGSRPRWYGQDTIATLLAAVYYFSPIVLLGFFLVAFTIRSVRASATPFVEELNGPAVSEILLGPGGKPLPQRKLTGLQRRRDKANDFPLSQKLVFQWLSIGATSTFLCSAAAVISHVLNEHQWWCGDQLVIYIVGSFFVYSVLTLSLIDAKPSPTAAHLSTWILASVIDTIRLVAFILKYHGIANMNGWNALEAAISVTRLVLLLALIQFYTLFTLVVKDKTPANSVDESTSLLGSDLHTNGSLANGHQYGATRSDPYRASEEDDDQPGWARPDKTPSRSWWEYIKGYSIFFPYLWPSKDPSLQLIVLLCFGLVIIQRGVNVLVPYQIGVITDTLTSGTGGQGVLPWQAILLYIFYRVLQGSNGLIGTLRSTLWIPVSQYSYRELSVASFEHVHSLSLDFHLGKKTGEVLSALGKGSSINTFLDQVTFQVLPMIIDLTVAIGYFLIAFDAYYALVVAVMTFWYIYITIWLARWRADARRKMVKCDRHQDAVKNDSMVSYETVKYFNAENYEFNRYREAIRDYQRSEYTVTLALQVMNISQTFIFMLGLTIVCFIAAYQVSIDKIRVGKFVSLLTYMVQLQSPLTFFGTFYRVIQSSMIAAERMLELFKEQPTVVDRPGASELAYCNGDIAFKDVRFAYDFRKDALQGMSFHCKPGTTTAFVGESGGGKSTVFRLLFRFYNAQSGSIEVDGQNIEDMTIESLRRHIGVVPQDTVLFNESIMYNLKYANPEATDEDVFVACRAASIHDKILSFPDGYETKVGERGLRLSGGEKQRVAIARTILKGPRIIMLDEATAALDTETEQHIQAALNTLAQGRTMLVIAHRLSTIVRADQILVLHDGRVVERGTHSELVMKKGRYENMWRKQVEAQKAAQEARVLKNKAIRLRRESKGDVNMERMSSASGSNSNSDYEDSPGQKRHGGREHRGRDEERGKSDDEQQAQDEALRMRHFAT